MTGPSSARLGPEATAAAFEEGIVARTSTRDVVLLRGPDAQSFLQGQCSQDLSALGPGATADALVLSVQGKVVALVRIWARAVDDLILETAAGYGPALHERLRRFKIRVKAELELASWPLVEVRGPGALDLVGSVGFGAAVPTGASWPALDLLGEATTTVAGVPLGDEETFEAARIEAGLPQMGSELDERTIPHEAGIVPWTVSFTKGCFTGQELVARLDARGARVPRLLRGVLGPARPGALAAGWALLEGDREVGRVTSAAFSPFRGATVALAYVRREVVPPIELAAMPSPGEGDPVPVGVAALPLREAPSA